MLNKKAAIGKQSPLFSVSDWVQGEPTNLDKLTGRVVLLEVFQVNCPGCFIYALPEAIEIHSRYSDQDLTVIGIATAFEDFDKNTLKNLRTLAETGQVVGETLNQLEEQGSLVDGCLPYVIPFPLAMDRLIKRESPVSDEKIVNFIHQHIPNFNSLLPDAQKKTRQQIRLYFEKLDYSAETFELFNLKGTPSQIIIDKKGILREISFGIHSNLEGLLVKLLKE